MSSGVSDKSQKTEKPTGRQLERAYDKGSLPRSQDVGPAVSLAVFILWAFLGGGFVLSSLMSNMTLSLEELRPTEDSTHLLDGLKAGGVFAFRLLGILLVLLFVTAIAQSLAQTGYHPRKHPIPFEPGKLNPIPGLKKLLSLDKVVQALKAVVRLVIYAVVVAGVLIPAWPVVTTLPMATPGAILEVTQNIAGEILLWALAASIVLAAIDYSFARYRWYRGLYMTKKEVKDEQKENEGNPETKQKIRAKQREIFRRRMMSSVKTADVVVTNPTHVAVALEYKRDTMKAPTVLAKGRGYVAARIKEEARKHSVPIVEDPPLARAMEKICIVGHEIPEVLFRAVAEVFAYVFGRPGAVYREHPEVERLLRPRRVDEGVTS